MVVGLLIGALIGTSSARRTSRTLRATSSLASTPRTALVLAGIAVGVALVERFEVSFQFFAFAGLASMGLEHIVVDRATHRLARATTMRAGFFGFVLLSADAIADARPGRMGVMLLSAALVALTLAALSAIARSGLGRGDVRLASVLALHLSSLGAIVAVRGIVLAFLVGGVVALVLLVTRRATRSSTFAFGPYLVVCSFIVVFAPSLGR